MPGVSPPSEHLLEGTGGRIFTRHWRPSGPPKAALVICHGFNAHGGHYDGVARDFAAQGYAVTAPDLRGRGRSDGERFYIESADDYVADLSLAVEFAKAKDPGIPCFVLGHSAGGVAAVAYALDFQDRIDGLICESFAFRVPAPDFALTVLKGVSHVAPHLHVLKLKMEDFSRDPAWVEMLLADPLTKDESQPSETIAALLRAAERFDRDFPTITLPLLILHGTADKATRFDGSQQFHDQANSGDKTLILYEGYFHDPLHDIGRERVFADVLGWLEARSPQRPAGQATMPTAT